MIAFTDEHKQILFKRFKTFHEIIDNIGISSDADILCALGAWTSSFDRALNQIDYEMFNVPKDENLLK